MINQNDCERTRHPLTLHIFAQVGEEKDPREASTNDPRKQTDWANTKQTDQYPGKAIPKKSSSIRTGQNRI
jgi:hypothetical protein